MVIQVIQVIGFSWLWGYERRKDGEDKRESWVVQIIRRGCIPPVGVIFCPWGISGGAEGGGNGVFFMCSSSLFSSIHSFLYKNMHYLAGGA